MAGEQEKQKPGHRRLRDDWQARKWRHRPSTQEAYQEGGRRERGENLSLQEAADLSRGVSGPSASVGQPGGSW